MDLASSAKHLGCLLFLIGLIFLSPGVNMALAQGVGQPALDLSRQQQTVPDPVETLREAPQQEPEEAVLPSRQEPTEPAPTADVTFELTAVTVTGSTVYGDEELQALFSEFIGTQISLGALRTIADRIEAFYQADDYVATRALVPAQRISGGAVRIDVYEGVISEIVLQGDTGNAGALIESYLRNLQTGDPLRWSDAERYLLLARDIPGVSLTSTLRPAADGAPGGVDLIVDVVAKPYEFFGSINNRGSQATGEWSFSAGAAANSVTRFGDQIQIVGLSTSEVGEQAIAQISGEMRLGDEGLTLKGFVGYGKSIPGDPIDVAIGENDSFILNGEVEYPVLRSRGLSLWTNLGFDFVNQDVSNASDQPILSDRIRTLYARMDGAYSAAPFGAGTFSAELRKGFTLGIGPDEKRAAGARSRLEADDKGLIARGSLVHAVGVPGLPLSLYFDTRFQYSEDPLFAYEEMALGNLTIGRGYDPGALAGDSGIAGAVELRWRPPELGIDEIRDVELFSFADAGRVYNNDTTSTGPEQLVSVGGGLRLRAFDSFYSELAFAFPLEPALSTDNITPSPKVLFRLTGFF